MTGERLTRDEALDLVRRAVVALTESDDVAVSAAQVRRKARELLGRDSESLSERFFNRILSDAADAHLVDLRRRGDVYEVAPVAESEPAAVQPAAAAPTAPEPSQAARSAAGAASLRRGIRSRGGRPGGRPTEVPPELLSIGVVETSAAAKPSAPAESESAPSIVATRSEQEPESATQEAPAKRKRATRGTAKKATKKAAKTAARPTSRGRKAAAASAAAESESAPAVESSSQPVTASSSGSAPGGTPINAASQSETRSKDERTTGAESRRKRAGRKKSVSKSSAATPAAGATAAGSGEGSGV
jgi:hypothetical protein